MNLCKQSWLILAAVLITAPAWAQGHPGRHYDPKAVVTVQGQVEKVETFSKPGRGGMETQPGRQLQLIYLKTDKGTVTVHLGPEKFLEQQQFTPKAGDSMTVTGAKMTTGQGEVIVAAEVKADGKSVTLRDAQGVPVWRGQGRGGRPLYDPKDGGDRAGAGGKSGDYFPPGSSVRRGLPARRRDPDRASKNGPGHPGGPPGAGEIFGAAAAYAQGWRHPVGDRL